MIRFALLALLASCTTTLPAGAVCQKSADCDQGLQCLEIDEINGTSCTKVDTVCTIPCTAGGSECATLGASYMCFATCNAGDMVCGATGP